jgi:dihydroorotate dehydrogenase electron transfer subunit
MYDGLVRVAHQEELGAQTHLLTLDAPAIAQETQPGQFVMLQSAPRGGPLLRRPFSVQRVHDDGGIEILYKVVGVGTAAMAALVPGDRVTALGPLGHPFTMPSRSEHAVLLGGGVGIPPMVILSDHLRAAGHTAWTALLGLRSAMQRGAAVGFHRGPAPGPGQVEFATMDGSLGHKGHVVSLLRTLRDTGRLDGPLRLYACGPMAMLRAVAVEAANLRVPCEVSVETMMGCGVGVCMGCVIESSAWVSAADRRAFSPYDRWWLACKRGPVFDAQQVVLDDGGLLH